MYDICNMYVIITGDKIILYFCKSSDDLFFVVFYKNSVYLTLRLSTKFSTLKSG